MLTSTAQRYRSADLEHLDGVTRTELNLLGIGPDRVAAQLAADRWRAFGLAIVLHNGRLTREQSEHVVLINCGPRAVLTSFTAATRCGLRNWDRSQIHVLAPAGTTRPNIRGLILHRTGDWTKVRLAPLRGCTASSRPCFWQPRASGPHVPAAASSRPPSNSGSSSRVICRTR